MKGGRWIKKNKEKGMKEVSGESEEGASGKNRVCERVRKPGRMWKSVRVEMEVEGW